MRARHDAYTTQPACHGMSLSGRVSKPGSGRDPNRSAAAARRLSRVHSVASSLSIVAAIRWASINPIPIPQASVARRSARPPNRWPRWPAAKSRTDRSPETCLVQGHHRSPEGCRDVDQLSENGLAKPGVSTRITPARPHGRRRSHSTPLLHFLPPDMMPKTTSRARLAGLVAPSAL